MIKISGRFAPFGQDPPTGGPKKNPLSFVFIPISPLRWNIRLSAFCHLVESIRFFSLQFYLILIHK
jgi:hypothetical protein